MPTFAVYYGILLTIQRHYPTLKYVACSDVFIPLAEIMKRCVWGSSSVPVVGDASFSYRVFHAVAIIETMSKGISTCNKSGS